MPSQSQTKAWIATQVTQGGWPSADPLKYHGKIARAQDAACYVMLSCPWPLKNQLSATRLALVKLLWKAISSWCFRKRSVTNQTLYDYCKYYKWLLTSCTIRCFLKILLQLQSKAVSTLYSFFWSVFVGTFIFRGLLIILDKKS